MDLKRIGSRPSGRGPADWFTGTVRIDPLFGAPEPARASVTFEPGARTPWHAAFKKIALPCMITVAPGSFVQIIHPIIKDLLRSRSFHLCEALRPRAPAKTTTRHRLTPYNAGMSKPDPAVMTPLVVERASFDAFLTGRRAVSFQPWLEQGGSYAEGSRGFID